MKAKFSANAKVSIVTTSGQLLKRLTADANGIVPAWNGITDAGARMASDVYIVYAKDEKDNKKIFEIMVFR